MRRQRLRLAYYGFALSLIIGLAVVTAFLSLEWRDASIKNDALTTELAKSGADNDTLIAELAESGADNDALTTELAKSGADNDTLTAELAKSGADNDALTAELAKSGADNDALAADLAKSRADYLALEDRYKQSRDNIAILEDARDALAADLSSANAQLRDTRETVATLESEVDAKDRQVTILSEQLDVSRERAANAQGSLRALQAEVGTLADVSAEVERLNSESAGLNSEITDLNIAITGLKEERRILVFTKPVQVLTLACTGSMEPTLTCLDEITEVMGFDPADIVVDTVISFSPPAECGFDDVISILHRVVSVKEDGSNFLYQAKGDNNDAPDPCWIPFENITGAVTVVHKNVNPENADLRDSVNAAQSGYETARATYYREYTRACRFSPDVDRICYLSGSTYDNIVKLYDKLESWEGYYDCWLEVARGNRVRFQCISITIA